MKRLIVTLSCIVLLTLGIVWMTFRFLDFYTRKGETESVPNLIGKNEAEITALLKERFSYRISDSIYDKGKAKGIVLDQNPKPFQEVKIGRTVSVIINRKKVPLLPVPDITTKSISQD